MLKRNKLGLAMIVGIVAGDHQPVLKEIEPTPLLKRPSQPEKHTPHQGGREAARRVGGAQWERAKIIARKDRGLSATKDESHD